jgi:lipid-A-disaccharide synthase-like uncharacterized protein
MVRVTVLFYRYGWLSLHILSKLIVTSYNACQAWISLGYLIKFIFGGRSFLRPVARAKHLSSVLSWGWHFSVIVSR